MGGGGGGGLKGVELVSDSTDKTIRNDTDNDNDSDIDTDNDNGNGSDNANDNDHSFIEQIRYITLQLHEKLDNPYKLTRI